MPDFAAQILLQAEASARQRIQSEGASYDCVGNSTQRSDRHWISKARGQRAMAWASEFLESQQRSSKKAA